MRPELVGRTAIALVALLALAACATPNPHANIPRAPASNGDYDARAKYYKLYSLDSREGDHLFLHNGTRVYWPEDLLPAVDDDSPAAMAIRDHVAARGRVEQYNWLGTTGAVAAGVGLIGLPFCVAPLFLSLGDPPLVSENDASTATVAALVAASALTVVGFALLGVDWAIVGHDADVAGESADRAARTYPQALSDRLGVGVDADGRIVDHGSMPSVSPAPKAQSL
jgi:hypothetical protein